MNFSSPPCFVLFRFCFVFAIQSIQLPLLRIQQDLRNGVQSKPLHSIGSQELERYSVGMSNDESRNLQGQECIESPGRGSNVSL